MKAYVVGVMIGVVSVVSASAEPVWKPGQGRCMTPIHNNRSEMRLDAMLDALRSVGIAPEPGFSNAPCGESASMARQPAPAKIYLAGQ